VMTYCPLDGLGQSHVICTFWASRRCIGVINKLTVSLWITPTTAKHVVAEYTSFYTLVDCNPLTPLLWFVLDLSFKLFLHCYAAVGKISTDTSRRAVRLR